MPFAENFKNKKHSSIVSSFINKYQDELQSKKFSQDEVIDYLEKEKNQEQNKEKQADYDYIISLIKNWFANKQSFDMKKAQQTILSRLSKEQELQQKIEKASTNSQVLAVADAMLGKNFVDLLKNKYVANKQQGWELKR